MKLKPVNILEFERQQKFLEIFDNEHYFDASCEQQDAGLLISSAELKRTLGSESLEIISVIDNLIAPFEFSRTLSMQMESLARCEIDASKKTVVVCRKGITSYKAVKELKIRFPKADILSLAGGINDY